MALSDPTIRNAKPKERPYRLFDEKGLYIEVHPNGSKYFRLKYRIGGKEKLLALGVYPETTLKNAREQATEARKAIKGGTDPSLARKTQRQQAKADAELTFRALALDWHKKQSVTWVKEHTDATMRMMERDLFPHIGNMPAGTIKPELILNVLRRIEARGAISISRRALQVCRAVFTYAGITPNPCTDLSKRLAVAVGTNFDAVTEPDQLGDVLLAIDNATNTIPQVHAALRLLPLLFCRSTELRMMRWADVDLDKAEWRYTVTKTKTGQIVPLADQALAILSDLKPLTGNGTYVFPSELSPRGDKPIARRTLFAALRRQGEATSKTTLHGFRATARTILDEVLGYRVDLIEHQLAHTVRDPLGRSYNRTSHLPERKIMMQGWADYLDTLKNPSSNVVAIRASV